MTVSTPPYLTGHMAPVPDETEARDLPVTGVLPPELTGRYFRNGPNPLPGEDPGHWFGGHGMLHGIRLRDGRARWYRNRWVRTSLLAGTPLLGGDLGVDRRAVTANTNIVEHHGRLLALVENGFPHEVTGELATVGPCDFDGRLTTAMTAHPKTDPATGELHFFGYAFRPPYLTYHRLSADGTRLDSTEIAVKGPTMMHDFALTEHHAVFLDLPMVHRPGARLPFTWDEGYGARLGVMPLDRPGQVRWLETDPCYVFHVGNAFEDREGTIVLDACRYAAKDADVMWGGIGPDGAARDRATVDAAVARLHRWTIDTATGRVTEAPLMERGTEFPTIDDGRTGRANRYLYAVASPAGGSARPAITRYDSGSGDVTAHELPAGVHPGEAVFVPSAAPDRDEGDGWLLSLTTTGDGKASQLLVLDATDLAGAPVAAVTLPRGVPAGFHGSWIADREDAN
ncbi:carotenoid cleavage dioxygenase [Actinacidiphila yanglinensis]|uniref:Dioxygenase n=1 Tax=Actinacidiphila yanglinensis TaxID=310779 RepID=A0A1H6E648_9ACTN|nr:carotenoid oxygenase family protein [Actinacidiphila yanglinensis]SEG93117.1 carotenoid cleavage dioxygenase [Actinacidiphila yanglinensis]